MFFKTGELYIYKSPYTDPCEIKFLEVNVYGNFNFECTWKHDFKLLVLLPRELQYVTEKKLWDSPLMKALR